MDVKLKTGWLNRVVASAAVQWAEDDLRNAERRVRQLNDELSDASTALKVAKKKLRELRR